MNRTPGYFEAIWLLIRRWIQNSVLYRILRRLYDGLSALWQGSRIATYLRTAHFSDNTVAHSLFGRIVGLPFTFLAYLRRRAGATLKKQVEQSRILCLCRMYLHNLLACNLRFIGVLAVFFGIGALLGALLSGRAIPWLTVLGAVIAGLLLCPWNINAADWLCGSGLFRFLGACLQIKPRPFRYYKAQTEARGRLWTAGGVGLLCGLLGGGAALYLGAGMLLGLAGFFLMMERPIIGLYALVFLAPLAPTMAMAALAVLTIFSLVIKSTTDPDFTWHHDGMSVLLLSFILIYLFCGLQSFARGKSMQIWAIYAVFIAGYFMVVNLVTEKRQLHHILTVFVLSGFLVCLYGIAQYVFGWDTAQAWIDEDMFSDIKMRIYSTLENPNVLGEYILLALPAAIGMMWISKNRLSRLLYAGISAVMLLALVLTFSRGCWIGLLAAAAVFITFAAGKLWGLALIALPLLPMVLPESIINRFTSIGDMKDSSTSYRVYIWMGTLAMIRDFWMSGIGMGAEAFTQVYPFYSYSGIVAPHSHNLFLQIWVESGVLGILVFLLILALFFKKAAVGYRLGGGKGTPMSTMICALCAGVCGFSLQGMFDNCFYNYRVVLIFWLVLGITMAICNVAKRLNAEEKEALSC